MHWTSSACLKARRHRRIFLRTFFSLPPSPHFLPPASSSNLSESLREPDVPACRTPCVGWSLSRGIASWLANCRCSRAFHSHHTNTLPPVLLSHPFPPSWFLISQESVLPPHTIFRGHGIFHQPQTPSERIWPSHASGSSKSHLPRGVLA